MFETPAAAAMFPVLSAERKWRSWAGEQTPERRGWPTLCIEPATG
jgi:hypothetical protein